MQPYLSGTNRAVDTGDTYFPEIIKQEISASGMAKDKLEERRAIDKLKRHGGKPLLARIEYARYIVDCPNCNGAEFAFEDKLFFCSQCQNSDIGGEARRVKMPNERKQIEEELGKRPIINRHWKPDKDVEEI